MFLKTIFHKHIFFSFAVVFLFSVFLGMAYAYDQRESRIKLFFFVISIALFFILTRQPPKNFWLITGIFSLLGTGMAAYFLLTNDWQQSPAKIGLINQLALWWMSVRPHTFSGEIYHNSAAGVMALSFPFTFAAGIHFWQKKQVLRIVFVLLLGGISIIGFLFTTSRGAVLAIFYGIFFWLLYELSRRLRHRFQERWFKVLRFIGIPSILIIAGWSFMILAGPVSLSNDYTFLTNSGTRIELYKNSIQLTEDFPIIGAGLSAFPGVYSTYILSIPNFFFSTAHDLYLNIAVEQGIFGFLSLIAIYLISLWSILKYEGNQDPLLVGAVFASLVIVILHNLVDNVIGDSFLSVLLFVIPGFTFGVVHPSKPVVELTKDAEVSKSFPSYIRIGPVNIKLIVLLVVIIFTAIIIFIRNPLLSSWYANLGAVQMAKTELVGFPTNSWDTGQFLHELGQAEASFHLSLQLNPTNRTANHRLGLIALMRQDFPSAVSYLEKAYHADPNHRGIIKNLGYAYTWTGQFDQALPLLSQIPESRQEMEVYQWWWGIHNRQDLKGIASDMSLILSSTPK